MVPAPIQSAEEERMPPNTIRQVECQHCATPFDTKRPAQAKWCPTCRALKQLIALSEHSTKCYGCDRRFHRHERRQHICSHCHPATFGVTDPQRPCAYCDAVTDLVPGLRLCFPCTEETGGAKHKKVVRSMVKAYHSRAAAQTPQPAAAGVVD
jgi:hypothetical protein